MRRSIRCDRHILIRNPIGKQKITNTRRASLVLAEGQANDLSNAKCIYW